jgi:hypothetical protein
MSRTIEVIGTPITRAPAHRVRDVLDRLKSGCVDRGTIQDAIDEIERLRAGKPADTPAPGDRQRRLDESARRAKEALVRHFKL